MIDARHYCWGLLALLLAPGCMQLEPKRSAAPLRPVRATLADLCAPRRAVDEAKRLPNTPAGQLRRAWLLTLAGQPRRAVQVANRLLYDRNRQPPSIQSLAFYVRGRAFARQGIRDRAREDLKRAGQLAVRLELRTRCATELTALGPIPKPITRPKPAAASTARVHIEPRRSWNAARAIPSRLDRMNGIHRLTIHHSANIARSTKSSVIATTIRSIQQVHISQNGWGDIGYHYLIDPAGRVWQGRSISYQGAHAGNYNNNLHNIGICLLGKFTGGGQAPSSRQIRAMRHLVGWLRSKYRIHSGAVLTHKEIKSQTICPGSRLQSEVNRMRRMHAGASPRPRGMAAGGGR